jgi:hypothetical protein
VELSRWKWPGGAGRVALECHLDDAGGDIGASRQLFAWGRQNSTAPLVFSS